MNGMGNPSCAACSTSGGLRRVAVYVAVSAAGVILWGLAWGTHLQGIPANAPDTVIGSTAVLLVGDLVFGIAAVALLPLRARHPLAIAIVTSAALTLSASASGAAVLAVVNLAVVGGRVGLILTGVVWTLAIFGNGALFSSVTGANASVTEIAGTAAVVVLVYLALVAIGRYRRARTETLRLLRERADNAERERAREVRAAQEAERLRIAREMHDVLAHRIALVSMHAGALTYRDDLPREKITEAAQVIQDSTALALEELRGLLGVLRDDDSPDLRGPLPVLDHLPILLADARAAGLTVETEFVGVESTDDQPQLPELNEATSRAAYRIVQEALTNARKHAPGEPVHLQIAHEDELVIESRNQLPQRTAATTPSGMGLAGLAERAHLAGGTLTAGRVADEFIVEARLPWN